MAVLRYSGRTGDLNARGSMVHLWPFSILDLKIIQTGSGTRAVMSLKTETPTPSISITASFL